ncbi:MAG: redox-sensing transcriptional repressor Rex [Chloroflexi bacterium]|nr:redox-sensing transcriptional repressor Rex [Chloroflexota bacterium]
MNEIPEVVIQRLPLYLRTLSALDAEGVTVVSSQDLGERLQVTPAQIRKDLSYFGRFGKQGRGYRVPDLIRELRLILGLGREWEMVLLGMGRLGWAVAGYPGFAQHGFKVVACFDADPQLIGKTAGPLVIQDISALAATIQQHGIQIGIVAVPAAAAQQVVDQLVACGVRGILNYAPTAPRVPPHVWVQNIDPAVALQAMTYHLSQRKPARRPAGRAPA